MLESKRWSLHKLDMINNLIIVLDKLSKREKTYHVPNSTHAILREDALYVSTLDNKVMRVCLHNGSRKLLDIVGYKNFLK